MITENIGLVRNAMRIYTKPEYTRHNPVIDSDDLFQAGMIGLIKAVDHFNPEKGYRFSTFATIVIRNEIYRELRHYETPTECADFTLNVGLFEQDLARFYSAPEDTMFAGVADLEKGLTAILDKMMCAHEKSRKQLTVGADILLQMAGGKTKSQAMQEAADKFSLSKRHIYVRYAKTQKLLCDEYRDDLIFALA